MMKSPPYIFFLIGVLLSLTACNPFATMRPTTERIQTRHWAPMDKLKPVEALYCYRSLGTVECYHDPQVGREDCLVGTTPIIEPITEKEKEDWRYKVKTFLKKVSNTMNGNALDSSFDPTE